MQIQYGKPSEIQMLISYVTDWFQCSPSQGVQRTGFITHQLIGGMFGVWSTMTFHSPATSHPRSIRSRCRKVRKHILYTILY